MVRGTITRANLPQENASTEFFGGNDQVVDIVTGRRVGDHHIKLEHGSVLAQDTHVVGGRHEVGFAALARQVEHKRAVGVGRGKRATVPGAMATLDWPDTT